MVKPPDDETPKPDNVTRLRPRNTKLRLVSPPPTPIEDDDPPFIFRPFKTDTPDDEEALFPRDPFDPFADT